MRHSCLFAAVSLTLLTLSGCRVDSGGDSSSTLNPASNVDLTFSTFDLADTDRAPNTLSKTRFADFYPGIEPNGADQTAEYQATAADIRRHIDRFIGAEPTSDGKSYRKVRNPLDLMNQVISVGRVDNFDEGRGYIRRRIEADESGTYNSRANQASIRFTDQAATLETRPLNAREWRYQTLDWRYQAGSETGHVYRTIQHVARSVDAEDRDKQPQLLSVLAGSRFNAASFSAIGYNQPEYATADYVSRDYGGIELRQEFIGTTQKDTLYIKSPEQAVIDFSRHGFNMEDDSPDCLRIELDYGMSKVHLFVSNDEPARIPDPEEDPADYENADDIPTVSNPANCANQPETEFLMSWNAESTPDRQ